MNCLKPSAVLRHCLPLLLLFAFVLPVNALQVSGLYTQQVAVSNESDAERNRAFTEALSAVILKVTGERRWLQHPTIEQALRNAQSYIEAISYSSETIVLEAEPVVADSDMPATSAITDPDSTQLAPPILQQTMEQRYINITFASSLINELLAGANIPVWDSNRPSVLVWMALQDETGDRSLLTADAQPQIIELIQNFAEQRGLPIIFPLLDFEDRRNLSEDQVWSLDQQAIAAASLRYGADSVLSGRLLFTAGGELVGRWQFTFQDQAELFDGFNEELQAYLYDPLDRVTNQLASYFAIVPETSNQQTVRLRVEGIKNLTAYSALLSYVSNLGLVETVATAELDGERLELELALVGDADQLFELIALDRDLLPIESSLLSNQSFLHYRWTR